MKNQPGKIRTATLLTFALMAIIAASSAWAGGGGKKANPGILPPQSHAFGKSYAEWSAKWWQWFLEQPVVGGPTDPSYDIGSHQSGKVWFLASALSEPVIEIPIKGLAALGEGPVKAPVQEKAPAPAKARPSGSS